MHLKNQNLMHILNTPFLKDMVNELPNKMLYLIKIHHLFNYSVYRIMKKK